MMNLSSEERQVGKDNFYNAVGVTRRDFLKGTIAAGAVSGAGLGAMYFQYEALKGNPVRVGFVGVGDEGNVLLGAHTPQYLEVKAIADIRPYSIHRAFHGDQSSPSAYENRPGLLRKYGWTTEDEARKRVKVYTNSYEELLRDPDIEAVVIALPLHLHAEAAIKALKAGKHVLTEKLMGHSVAQCKEMGRVAAQTGLLLATGHQRHYSILYDNAVQIIRQRLIGDVHHIRAQWHRGNLPGNDSWQQPLPDDQMLSRINDTKKKLEMEKDKPRPDARRIADLTRQLQDLQLRYTDREVDAARHGYEEKVLANGYKRTAMEELIRWRLWQRTGGGLMAELGSHQLDAASIFIAATRPDGKKVMPLSVAASGGRHIFPLDRECEDHVYCMFEFPGPEYDKDPEKKIVMTYSSINGNGFGGYGEIVFGTAGTLMLERESEVLLFKGSSTSTRTGVRRGSDGPTLDTTQSGDQDTTTGKIALESGPPSRGYTEELEHWAWCIRNPAPENRPRCEPKVALADAVIALTTNQAIRGQHRIEFKHEWFEIDSDETPDGQTPNLNREEYAWS